MEDFSCSEKTGLIMTALGDVQHRGLKPHKNASNPHFKSKYADLECVLDTAREVLDQKGLTVAQMPLGGVEVCRLLIRVHHSSGEWLQWIFTTPVSKKDPQGIGAAITYLRRFSLVSVFNMVDSDDDGNTASTPNTSGYIATKSEPDVPSYYDSQHGDGDEKPATRYVEQLQQNRAPTVGMAPIPPASQQQRTQNIQGQQKKYTPNPEKAVTEKQLKFFFVKVKQAGYSMDEVDSYIRENYFLESKTELNQVQFNEVLDAVEARSIGGIPDDKIPF